MLMDFIPARNKTSGSCFGPGKAWPMMRKYLLIVIHWTAGSSESAVSWFQSDSNLQSSAHYVIDTNGKIVNMVTEENVAWHAGVSSWKDYPTYPADKINFPFAGDWNSLNPCSLGIELEGPPSCIQLYGWKDAQIKACAELCNDIFIRRPDIKIIDHSRICSTKIDVLRGTGKSEDVFPWQQLLDLSGVPEA